VEDDHLDSAVCFFFTQVFGSIFHSRAVFFHMIFSMFSGEMGATPRFFATLPKLWNISTARRDACAGHVAPLGERAARSLHGQDQGRDCRAAEIQRIAENAPRWPE
jgi:hypothetical protein